MKPLQRTTLGCALVAAGLLIAIPPAFADGICTSTAKLQLKACKEDAKDDYYLTRAQCENLADPAAHAECVADSKPERDAAIDECRVQYFSRLDLCGLVGENAYDPQIDPANFVDPLAIGDTVEPNPYFPLTPGWTRVYEAGDETIVVTNTYETVEILGVTCLVVRDTVSEDGELVEDTTDWFAQHIDGSVWYFGEIARNFEDGELTDLDGSFKAGVDGAKAGIVMQAMPMAGVSYREEWALGDAEDAATVISTAASESSPFVDCVGDCVQTSNFTPLEPGIFESKFYAPGIGVIVGYNDAETEDREELVDRFFTEPEADEEEDQEEGEDDDDEEDEEDD
ncbi:MAG: hypothetical protein KDG50_01260 [Chromatiales bacterium]|nr:hypothetical protein [Chromatiales bacterium]